MGQRAHDEDYAWKRQRDRGEGVRFYGLEQEPEPYFNPPSANQPGILTGASSPGPRGHIGSVVGRTARGYAADPLNVSIEGTRIISDEVTTDATPTIERTATLDTANGSLSMVAGDHSGTTGGYAYTFLAYLKTEPAE